jgi:hypothetical protein
MVSAWLDGSLTTWLVNACPYSAGPCSWSDSTKVADSWSDRESLAVDLLHGSIVWCT